MNQLTELQKSLDELNAQKDATKNKSLVEKYGVIINGIQDTLTQIIKSGGIITNDEYNRLDELIKNQKIKFLQEDAITSRNNMILITGGVIVLFVALYWLSSKKNKI